MFSVDFACKYLPCTRCASITCTNLAFRKIDMFLTLFSLLYHSYIRSGSLSFPLICIIWGKTLFITIQYIFKRVRKIAFSDY
jgi:hypothetical protein